MANRAGRPWSTRPVGDAPARGIVRVRAAVDRRSWGILRGHFSARDAKIGKPPVEAAGAVDAKNAPTAPWKTAQNAVSHSSHRPFPVSLVTGKVLPMFPVNFVTYVPGCTLLATQGPAPLGPAHP